jgi:hypothetical protein
MGIKKFSEFILTESFSFKRPANIILEGASKEDSYRSIAYKLSEIFGLYGFFFAQKKGFFNPGNWPKLMTQIIAVKDPEERWKTAVEMSNFLQGKVASLSDLPIQPGEFGARGQYDYGQETQYLPDATKFLKSASNAALKNFTPEEQAEAMQIMDEILGATKPLEMKLSESQSFLIEKQRFIPPSSQDLLRLADSIGAKLLNMYDMLDNLTVAYPDSKNQVISFQDTYIVPNVNKVKSIMQNDIPNVGEKAAEGYYKKLQAFDNEVASLIPKADTLRQKLVSTYQPIAAAAEFERSAQNIIDKVREGILRQAENNIRRKKSTDVVAGTTDINDPNYSGDAQSAKKKKEDESSKKKRNVDDLSAFLSKKYSIRK